MESIISRIKKAASLLLTGIIAGLGAGLGAAGALAADCPPGQATHVQVGAQSFQVEVAATEAERQRGLSGHPRLAADAGMWFVMPGPGHYAFWMQGMAFAIDLIWIDAEGSVLGAAAMTPCSSLDCPAHTPPAPANFILEVNAGQFTGRPGDRVHWTCQAP